MVEYLVKITSGVSIGHTMIVFLGICLVALAVVGILMRRVRPIRRNEPLLKEDRR